MRQATILFLQAVDMNGECGGKRSSKSKRTMSVQCYSFLHLILYTESRLKGWDRGHMGVHAKAIREKRMVKIGRLFTFNCKSFLETRCELIYASFPVPRGAALSLSRTTRRYGVALDRTSVVIGGREGWKADKSGMLTCTSFVLRQQRVQPLPFRSCQQTFLPKLGKPVGTLACTFLRKLGKSACMRVSTEARQVHALAGTCPSPTLNLTAPVLWPQ